MRNAIYIFLIYKENSMKIENPKMKRTCQIAAIPLAIALALATVSVQAGEKAAATGGLYAKEKAAQITTHKLVVKEAVDAFKATETALFAIQKKQAKHALAALEVASGNLHLMLARDPELNLVPLDINIEVLEGTHDLKTIKKLQDELEGLIKHNRYQSARPIINSMVDELRVTVVSLPLATYPAVIDSIAPLIDAGKWKEAEETIRALLDTLVSEQQITPLAIIRAEEQINQAFQLESAGDSSKKQHKNEITALIKEAKQNIKVAEALGYASQYEYKPLYNDIAQLQKVIGTSGIHDEWVKIKNSLSALKNKIVRIEKGKRKLTSFIEQLELG